MCPCRFLRVLEKSCRILNKRSWFASVFTVLCDGPASHSGRIPASFKLCSWDRRRIRGNPEQDKALAEEGMNVVTTTLEHGIKRGVFFFLMSVSSERTETVDVVYESRVSVSFFFFLRFVKRRNVKMPRSMLAADALSTWLS